MSHVNQLYVDELLTRPDTVVLAQAIHRAWRDLPNQHSVPNEGAGEWDDLTAYMQAKFLVAADQVEDTMHWTKVVDE